jgi:hypothetical protein
MCHEWYLRRRAEEDESREMWRDFERTELIKDPKPPVEVTDPEPAEVREAIATPER